MFDARSGTYRANQIIVIRDGIIADLGPAAPIPAGARVIDLSGATVLPGMIERRRGAIVAISSVNGQTYVGNEAYSAAKAGLDNLVQSVATRYGRHGIRCNAVAPGTVRTDASGIG